MSVNIGDEVKAVRKLHPEWTFEESWNHVTATRPESEASSAESNRVAAKLAPEKEKEARAKSEHIEAIARRLMARDRGLTFGRALQITRDCLPSVQAGIEAMLRHAKPAGKPKGDPAGRVEAGEDCPPHPGLAAAQAKGLLLVEGGFATPIFPRAKS